MSLPPCFSMQSEKNENGDKKEHLELAFEYLVKKDEMEWITIYSSEVKSQKSFLSL